MQKKAKNTVAVESNGQNPTPETKVIGQPQQNTKQPETKAISTETAKTAPVSPKDETTVAPEDKLQLKQCEDNIRQNEGGSVSIGRNLGEISSEQLYKAAGYADFGVYCKERWGISDKYAYRLINAAKCLDKLTSHEPTGTWVLPRNESQIRPVAQLKEEQWMHSWEKVMAKFGTQPFTAEDVKDVLHPEQAKVAETVDVGDKADKVSAKKLQKKLIKIDEIVNKALAEEIAAKEYRKFLEQIKKLIEKSTEKTEKLADGAPTETVASTENTALVTLAPAAPTDRVITKKTKTANAA